MRVRIQWFEEREDGTLSQESGRVVTVREIREALLFCPNAPNIVGFAALPVDINGKLKGYDT